MTSGPSEMMSAWTASTFARNASSSTVNDSELTATTSAERSGRCIRSSSSAAARADSYLPPMLNSVVVAESRYCPTQPKRDDDHRRPNGDDRPRPPSADASQDFGQTPPLPRREARA